jgi:uncharacterized membrane protein
MAAMRLTVGLDVLGYGEQHVGMANMRPNKMSLDAFVKHRRRLLG